MKKNKQEKKEKRKRTSRNNNKKLNDRFPAILIITLYVDSENIPIKRDCQNRSKTRKN